MQRGFRFLIVDDHADFRCVLAKLLSFLPEISRIDQAVNGREALDDVAQRMYDVVLMDMHMPDLDGLQATSQIKACWPKTKIVALSVDPSFRDAALAAGADCFIAKDRIVPELEVILGELFADAP